MMNARLIDEGEGVRAARAGKRRFLWISGLAILGAAGIGLIMAMGKTGPGQIQPGFAIAAALAMLLLAPAAIHFTTRATDELEHMDGLRANSFGLYSYLIGQFVWIVLAAGGLVPPPNAMIMFFIVAAATLGRYGMLKLAR